MESDKTRPPKTVGQAASHFEQAGQHFANADKIKAKLDKNTAKLKQIAEPKIEAEERAGTRLLRGISIFWRLRGRQLALPRTLLKFGKGGVVKDRNAPEDVEITDEDALIASLRKEEHPEAIEEKFAVRKTVLKKLLDDNPELWKKLSGIQKVDKRLLTYVIPEEGSKTLQHDPKRKPRWFVKAKRS